MYPACSREVKDHEEPKELHMSVDLSKICLNVLDAYYYCCCLFIMFNVVMPEEVNMVVVPVFMFVSSCLIDAF